MNIEEVIAAAVRETIATELPRALEAWRLRDPEEPLAVGVATAARLLDQPEETIREWVRNGTLKATKPAKRGWLIPMTELHRLISPAEAEPEKGPSPRAQAAAVLSTLPLKKK